MNLKRIGNSVIDLDQVKAVIPDSASGTHIVVVFSDNERLRIESAKPEQDIENLEQRLPLRLETSN